MNIVSGDQRRLPEGLYSALSAYRHEVFVELLGWELDTPKGMEEDQFDRNDTVYVVSRDQDNAINGCARLLPTTRPYLLREVFPELLNGEPAPQSEKIWELSRFAAVDLKTATGSRNQMSSPIAVTLLKGAISCAASLGANRLITVSPLGIERLLRHAGFVAHRAGPPKVVGGYPLFACWIEIAEEMQLRRSTDWQS